MHLFWESSPGNELEPLHKSNWIWNTHHSTFATHESFLAFLIIPFDVTSAQLDRQTDRPHSQPQFYLWLSGGISFDSSILCSCCIHRNVTTRRGKRSMATFFTLYMYVIWMIHTHRFKGNNTFELTKCLSILLLTFNIQNYKHF